MSIPPSIGRVLDNHGLPHDLMGASEFAATAQAAMSHIKFINSVTAKVLKADDQTLTLALHATDRLLDLNAVQQATGKQYLPLAGEQLQTVLAGMGSELAVVPAIPMIKDMHSLVDKNLLDYEVLYLNTGVDNQLLRTEQEHFKLLINDSHIAEISQPLEDLNSPLDQSEDESEIRQSVSLFTERRIKQRLEETLDIPPLPASANKIIQLRVDPHADISDLTDIVELDPSLSAQIVSWAGSPYYSAPGAIKSIHDAIVRVLGFDVVLNLALGLSLGKTLKMPKAKPELSLPYWQQSVYTAVAAEALVTCIPRAHRPSFGTAYLSGLLHNFGYLIISEVFDNQFKAICDCIDANVNASVQAAERRIIGVDRNQLAAWLMEFWNMPSPVITALRYQSTPEYDGEDWQYSLLLFVCAHLLQEQGIFTGSGSETISDTVFERLKLSRKDAEEAIQRVIEQSEELLVIAGQMG